MCGDSYIRSLHNLRQVQRIGTCRHTPNQIHQLLVDTLRHRVLSFADVLKQLIDVVALEWVQARRDVIPAQYNAGREGRVYDAAQDKRTI